MAVDKLIEDDSNTYYVDSNGVMVKNTWVKVVNEDQDDDDDPAEYNYYYMQSNGKAYKQGASSSLSKKTIDGKVYAFDEDGKMLYGWVDSNGDMQNGESDWATTDEELYYFGSWDDGAMKTGWQRITVYDDDENKEDDYDYWFNFKSNGKRRASSPKKKINGKYYAFDARGVMIYEWYMTGDSATKANGTTTATKSQVAQNWNYFSSPEDGARVVKGWFKVVPPEDDNTFLEDDETFATKDSEDESERWYYADGDGLVAGQIKKIKGKYYAFWPEDGEKGGRMLTGLCALKMNGEYITQVLYDNMDSDDLDKFMNNKENKYDVETTAQEDGKVYLYYFGADSQKDTDGAMKTGATTITLDGESYNFYFSKTGGAESKGRGVNGLDDKDYVYVYGQKIKADSDEKYRVVYASGDYNDSTSIAYDMDLSDFRKLPELDIVELGTNKDHETVKGILGDQISTNYYLVNTSGKIQKSATARRDGDDWYWYIDNYNIKMYTNNKTLPTNSDVEGGVDYSKKSVWQDFGPEEE
jgi:glucan-binding YG repeat protein